MLVGNWKFEQNGNIISEDEKIKLYCIRVKDAFTYKEFLHICTIRSNDYNGKIITSLLKISDALFSLREYGLILKHVDILQIKKIIEDNYYNIRIKPKNRNAKLEIYKLINEYLDERKKLCQAAGNDKEYNQIPILEFKELIEHSGYSGINLTDLKKQLLADKCIECNKGRLDKLVRLDSKNNNPIRAIVFNADELNKQIQASVVTNVTNVPKES